jgi:hypothetical protein
MSDDRLKMMEAWYKKTSQLIDEILKQADEISERESVLPDGPERDQLRAQWGELLMKSTRIGLAAVDAFKDGSRGRA